MEFTNLIVPETKNICRTCLLESDVEMLMNVQDLIEHEMHKVKLIDILIFLNCLENNDEDNWPQGICASCVSTALIAYNFKLNCLKANTTLSRILTIQSPTNLQRSDIDSIDINVVYQDHEYDVPLFSNPPVLDFDTTWSNNKELTPLPPVTEITATEQPMRQEGEKRYACSICSKTYTRIYGLKYHMNKHLGICRYLCPKCGKKFPTSSGLAQHLSTHKNIAQFKCGFCNKSYKSRQTLKKHFRVAHSSNRNLFVCVTCGKTFTAKSTLMMHVKTHNGEKQYPCPHCSKSYTRASYLKAHMVVHTGQERPKPFACTYTDCDRRFATKHSLLVHIAHTHNAERPYKCSICFKRFPTITGLGTHREAHYSKMFNCMTCEKTFTSKRVLQKHMKTHDVEATDMILETVVDNVFFD